MLILDVMDKPDFFRHSTVLRPIFSKTPWDIVSCILIGILFYQDMLFGGQVIVFRDTATILHPTEVIAHHLLQTSWLPLWNPFFVLGKPFVAEPLSGALYPPQWIFRQFTLPLSISLNLYFHHLLAAVGVLWCGRLLGFSSAIRLMSAVLFAFGGVFVALDNMTNALQSAAWLPISAGLSYLTVQNPRDLRLCSIQGIVLSLSFLGGMPEVVLLEILLFIFCWIAQKPSFKSLFHLSGLIALSLLICLCLSAAELIPLIEYIHSSQRSYGLDPDTIFRFSAHPSDILAFISVPRPFTEQLLNASAATPNISGEHWAISLYLGPSLVFLAILVQTLRPSLLAIWSFATALIFALSLGRNMPGLSAMITLLPIQIMRYPDKMLLLVHFILIAGVAVGLSFSINQPRHFKFVGLLLTIGSFGHAVAWFLLRNLGYEQMVLTSLSSSALYWLLVGTFAFAASLSPRLIPFLLLVLAGDVLLTNYKMHPQLPWSEVMTPAPSTPVMSSNAAPTQIYSALRAVRSSDEKHEDLFQRAKVMLQDGISSLYGLRNISTPSSINLASHTSLIFLLRSLPINKQIELLSALGTRYLVVDQAISSESARLFSKNKNILVYELLSTLPFVYVPSHIVEVENMQSWKDTVQERFTLGAAIVEAPSSALEGLTTLEDSALIETSKLSYKPGLIEFTITTQRPTLVVINESYYPGWTALINGETSPLYRTNGVVMGLRIPQGDNMVRLAFQPTSLFYGIWISGLTLAALTLFLAFHLKESRRKSSYLGKLRETDGFSSIKASPN